MSPAVVYMFFFFPSLCRKGGFLQLAIEDSVVLVVSLLVMAELELIIEHSEKTGARKHLLSVSAG